MRLMRYVYVFLPAAVQKVPWHFPYPTSWEMEGIRVLTKRTVDSSGRSCLLHHSPHEVGYYDFVTTDLQCLGEFGACGFTEMLLIGAQHFGSKFVLVALQFGRHCGQSFPRFVLLHVYANSMRPFLQNLD
jgi:hypothetical protein